MVNKMMSTVITIQSFASHTGVPMGHPREHTGYLRCRLRFASLMVCLFINNSFYYVITNKKDHTKKYDMVLHFLTKS